VDASDNVPNTATPTMRRTSSAHQVVARFAATARPHVAPTAPNGARVRWPSSPTTPPPSTSSRRPGIHRHIATCRRCSVGARMFHYPTGWVRTATDSTTALSPNSAAHKFLKPGTSTNADRSNGDSTGRARRFDNVPAQRRCSGLLIHWFWVRVPGGPQLHLKIAYSIASVADRVVCVRRQRSAT